MTSNAQLGKLLTSALGRRKFDLRAANEAAERLRHLDVDQTGRVSLPTDANRQTRADSLSEMTELAGEARASSGSELLPGAVELLL